MTGTTAPQQTQAKLPDGVSEKNNLPVRCLHASISLSSLFCIISGFIFTQLATIDWNQHPVLIHGFKYMTFFFSLWMSAFHTIYFNLYSIIDVIDMLSPRKPQLLKYKEPLHNFGSYLLFTVVFPFSLLVSILFWIFFIWDRETMYPKVLEEVFPIWMNHAMHTYPVILSVLYMYTSNKKVPSKSSAFAGLMGLMAIYAACLIVIRMKDGKWVYAAMEKLTPLQAQLTFSLSAVAAVIFFFLGYHINDKINELKKLTAKKVD